jgi:hypothetical protein
MNIKIDILKKILENMDADLQEEVINFIQFIILKKSKKKKYLNQSWAGGLSELKDKYTSIQLQKKSLEWMD